MLLAMIFSGLLIYWAYDPYRIGLGSVTVFHFFPNWFYELTGVAQNLALGMALHFFFAWIFAINGIAYVLYTLVSGEWRFLVPRGESLKEAAQVVLASLHIRKQPTMQKKYNGAQRIAYATVIAMGAGSLFTGLAIYKPTQLHLLTTALGGYEWARWEHFWLTMGFCLFFLVHVLQVAFAGWNNLRSMISGYEIRHTSDPSLDAERKSWR